MAVTQKPDGRWAVYYRKDGKVAWEYFGRGPEGEAAAHARNQALGLGRRARRRGPVGPLVADLAKSYVAGKLDLNDNSRAMLKIRLKANLLPHFGHLRAAGLTYADVDRYVKKRLKQPMLKTYGPKSNPQIKILRDDDGSPRYPKMSTINRELTDLKAILNWSTGRKPPLLRENPIRDYAKPPPDDAIILPPTDAEMRRILAAAKPHLLRALLLSYYLGLRPGAVELLTLRWSHVDFETGKIMVIGAAKGRRKQARRRMVPIHPAFVDRLKEWHKSDGEKGFIVHYGGKPIKKLQTTWEQCRRDAKITRRLRFYDIRHAHVTRALEAGADIGALAANVGSRPETLRKHYQHVSGRLQQSAVEAVPELPAILKPQSIAKKSRKKANK